MIVVAPIYFPPEESLVHPRIKKVTRLTTVKMRYHKYRYPRIIGRSLGSKVQACMPPYLEDMDTLTLHLVQVLEADQGLHPLVDNFLRTYG